LLVLIKNYYLQRFILAKMVIAVILLLHDMNDSGAELLQYKIF